ncbi:MAG TPA: hypothetical protein VN634_04820 [Candidatus Limnocylindrales bacterium]|nr:hypothetical protein [Candidatus Limnocylindrales bacterium]
MRTFSTAFVVTLVLAAGCTREKAETSPPVPAQAPPPAPATPPAAKPAASTTKNNAAPVAETPAPKPQAPARQPPDAPAAAAREPAASAPLDLDALKTQLKETKAIGVFTKLALKNQVDDLMEKFREHHAGKTTPSITELRRSYDLLMMKVLSLLQDHDQKLASEIVSSRERIWGLLADPKKFASLQT